MDQDNYYWLFSSAAQSVAALIAFLMAGVALAFSMMDRLTETDDTLSEVVEALRQQQHRQLSILAIATGIAIISSLLAVYLNPTETDLRAAVRVIAAFFDIAVVVGSIAFVVSVVRPSRYSRAARREYATSQKRVAAGIGQEPSNTFFREFIALEQSMRTYIEENNIGVPGRGAPRASFSFRQMVDALWQNERISRELRDLLLEVNKFRNLLFHGHMDQVSEGVVSELQKARSTWEKETDHRD